MAKFTPQFQSIDNETAKLPLLKWRGIEVPIADIATGFTHSLVKHKKPDLDGARIEATGRDEKDITAHCLFLNGGLTLGIDYNGGEKLFPDTYNRFWAACEDRSTGTLVHPTRGTFLAKVVSLHETLSSASSDGVRIDVAWNETNPDATSTLTSDSPVATMTSSASALDAAMPPLISSFPGVAAAVAPMTRSGATFSSLVSSIQGAASTATLVSAQYAGAIPQVLHQLAAVRQAFDDTGSAVVGPARQALERLNGSLNKTQSSAGVTSRVLLSAPTSGWNTLGALSRIFRTLVSDLIALNPTLAGVPQVPPDTIVRYYAPPKT